MMELLFLLLPVAAASGWWLARRDAARRSARAGPARPSFARGLNYLLDEQPDKAIDLFIELAEVDGETVETHLALGTLFRRRGEMERAIRIHQNLIARKTLTDAQRGQALFELGQDYLRAGLLDRAERLFQDLVALGLYRERALQGLRDIYQQERDWRQCLEVAARLSDLSPHPLTVEIAQYRCELAEEARRQGDTAEAAAQLALARRADPDCVRAIMLEGRMALEAGEADRAVARFTRLADLNAAYLADSLPDLIEALRRQGREDVPELLEELAQRHPSPPLLSSLSEIMARERGSAAAIELLIDHLERHADLAALERLFALRTTLLAAEDPGARETRAILAVVRQLLARQPVYQCEHCGFQARLLHWQCPSCRSWGSVKPVQPELIPGETPPEGPRLAETIAPPPAAPSRDRPPRPDAIS